MAVTQHICGQQTQGQMLILSLRVFCSLVPAFLALTHQFFIFVCYEQRWVFRRIVSK